jgi:hypothetical protein
MEREDKNLRSIEGQQPIGRPIIQKRVICIRDNHIDKYTVYTSFLQGKEILLVRYRTKLPKVFNRGKAFNTFIIKQIKQYLHKLC